MLKVCLIDGGGVMNYPRKAVSQIHDSFGLPSNNKLFSCNFSSRKKEVLSLLQKKDFKQVHLLSIELCLYSPNFSEFYRNTQAIKLHDTIQRSIGISIDVEAFGYCLYFDLFEKALRSTFYFLNENSSGQLKYSSGLSRKKIAEIESKIDGKLASYPHTSRGSQILRTFNPHEKVPEGDHLELMEPPTGELAKVMYDFSVAMTDPMIVVAIQRALKGLDVDRAKQLQAVVNSVIQHNGDPSIPLIDLPKKHTRSNQKDSSAPVSDDNSIMDLFEI